MRIGGISALESLEKRRLFSMTVTSYNPANSLSTLTNQLIVPSTGITVTGSSYVGHNAQGGTYTGFNLTSGSTNLTIPDGILLTSGSAAKAIGPYNSSDGGTALGAPGDSNLTTLIGVTTNDANALTLTFTTAPGTNSISFDLIFASEEFPTYVGS